MKSVLLIVFVAIFVIVNPVNAVTFDVNPSVSISHTSGGVTGGGIGDLIISGSFEVFTTSSTISFVNIDVIPSPYYGVSFIPDYAIPFDGINFSGANVPIENYKPVNISGSLYGSVLTIRGNIYGDITHNYTISATANVPAAPPATPMEVIDAPHNSTFDIKCNSCHSYSMWWQYSPSDQVSDRTCNFCHDGNNPSFPIGKAHSNTVTGSTKYTWNQYCIDCHDPHKQKQLEHISSNSGDLYLISGNIDSVVEGSQANTSEITYSGAPPDNLTGDWTDRSKWGKKNNNPNFDRGLILVVDRVLATNTYQVMSATPTTITVKGTVSSSDAGKSFGLIYGQLIKSEITTPKSGVKIVKFFDPNNGGLIEIDPSGTGNTTGLCQVCHTETIPFKHDGAAPTDLHNTLISGNCTTCHACTDGFANP